MSTIAVVNENEIPLPAEVIQYLGIYKGCKLEFMIVGDHVELRVQPEKSGFGMVKSNKPAVPVDFDPADVLLNS